MSHLWPRADAPYLGIFIADQVAALSRRCDVTVAKPADLTLRREEMSLRELISGRKKYRGRTQPQLSAAAGIKPEVFAYHGRLIRRIFARHTAQNLASVLGNIELEGFDLVHAHTLFPDGLACALWLQNREIPLVVTAHGSDVHSLSAGVRRSLGPLMQRANRFISVSQALADELIGLGAPPASLSVIPNGFSAELFHLPEFPPRNRKKIVFLGWLRKIKRVDLLIRALAWCDPKVTLDIGGEGVLRENLEALVAKLHMQNRVNFLGAIPREQIPHFMAGAALMCLMSEREGWPTVIFESLVCGTPVLAAAVGGIPEALNRPDLGVLVPRDISPKELAKQIQSALERPWDHQAIREYALRYSWEAISEKIVQVYHQAQKGGNMFPTSALSSNGRPPCK